MSDSQTSPAPLPQPICDSSALAERGKAALFRVRWFGQDSPAFVLRIDGQPKAYLNKCAHVPTEMDWQPGEFLDSSGQYILCSIHGAAYEPSTGHCVAGPCQRGRLVPVPVQERGGQVEWLPDDDFSPL